mmetsp:Transcript_64320/g.139715  ORF Transcript_64320/g.139715 Transcript_64320/m.139715 type:complete len:695 (-) Transcript_64320:110-2194(-)|eukprot:CAMPEP_0206479694 /NCGR_PEP_ID=MMETSP0324_2-20121206/36824_1 /ASSEMBLY_ACC=CAM_ASM_000836 /TAXON_ID=2866 /ORGANISM="Crypthecodinium cohnii, Strain Seligo" /LENGTH=694 /DNA_ID=CAMNT_0053956285 /DNA_START=158 /DNA_END=2242 /DNA_ORIENTATION=+
MAFTGGTLCNQYTCTLSAVASASASESNVSSSVSSLCHSASTYSTGGPLGNEEDAENDDGEALPAAKADGGEEEGEQEDEDEDAALSPPPPHLRRRCDSAGKDCSSNSDLSADHSSMLSWDDLFISEHHAGFEGNVGPARARLSRTLSRMADEGARAAEKARAEGTAKPQRLPDGTFVPARFWGISRHQVKILFEAAQRDPRWRWDMTVREFVDEFIKPSTAGTGRGVSLRLNESCPLQVTLMVSHAWVENAGEFFEDFLKNTDDHEIAFICFLANYQGTLDEVNDQLGNDLNRSPFTQVLKSDLCERMLVVPNETLRASGEGLYSRLWCDWEMKVAADAGIPIDIPTKNSWEHLLGHKTGSSRQARCGEVGLPINRDEQLIRKAVQSMPPDTAKSVALAICVWTTCAIFSPSVATKIVGDSIFVWLVGVPVGICLGLFLAWWITRCVRPSRRDGYEVLDRLIRGAALGWYCTRRFRVADLISMSIFVHCCGFAYVLFKRFVLRDSWSCAADGHMHAVTIAIPIWGFANVNKLGPWIGYFTASRTKKWIVAGLQLCCSAIAGVIDVCIQTQRAGPLDRSDLVVTFGRGWFLGWFFSWNFLSLSARKWLHLAMNLVVFIVIAWVRNFQGGNLYMTVFVLLMGINAVLVRPEWSTKQRCWIFLFKIVAIVGFLWLVLADAATGMFGTGFCMQPADE